ncbi:alpha-glucuronidase [Mucilaginibacter sp. SG564]|uniref:alpha-glucuronidase n=1 Tax=Mucilaginibacter sp. SG564 TaxID=2587022 RepID=UPI001552E298|nr:alpha-glucuronidase [Mucilaginibacter sp. SG564]NOW96402.1 alpha-glucuronidase [Mucilaginibacter sp. SG564]
MIIFTQPKAKAVFSFKPYRRLFSAALFLLFSAQSLFADNGHELWLRNKQVNPIKVICNNKSQTAQIAVHELKAGWSGGAGETVNIMIKTDRSLQQDGYKLSPHLIQANTATGALYGVFDFLRRQQTGQELSITSNPSYQRRILDHWDNPDGSIERGYAGNSIFWRKEDSLTVTLDDKKLWLEYARADASIGINGAVLNNVNASPRVLTEPYLKKVKEIADVLRTYGIKTYLSANFASPISLGKLKTADPLDPAVIAWWNNKVKEIYKIIPDFGGFLIKANSEGQPGPQDYKRTHVDGANMFADALKPYGGIVMWRAFVYNANEHDRAKQAYSEFMPFDGQFRSNVIIQVKNGPVDFQPREPFSPLFGALKKTAIMPELQVTKEYLGENIHLVFLASMWEELLKSDTYQQGAGSTVAHCTDGSIYKQQYTAIAGVSNIGLDSNWCGSNFDQANWYAFGRLAWNNQLNSSQIADEWIKLTFAPLTAKDQPAFKKTDWNNNFLTRVKNIMLTSREAAVNYMMPLGLHHLFSAFRHYGPGPWYAPKNVRTDWTPPYYHKAAPDGIGFDRTQSGSGAIQQYHEPLATQFSDLKTCPEIYLLWFHHVSWDFRLKSGATVWEELCHHYQNGVASVRDFQKEWDNLQPYVDQQRFEEVQSKLRKQCHDAQVYKDACLLYFQQYSKLPFPSDLERPIYDLQYLESIDPLTMEKAPVLNRRK